MKKAILVRFSMILFVALAVSSAISYFFMGNKLLVDNEKNLLNIVHMIDYSLEYRGDIQKESMRMQKQLEDVNVRLTIIGKDGTVLADTQAESYMGMENHLEREEIKMALSGKVGYAKRYSETMQEAP